jgi:hypothetical protein
MSSLVQLISVPLDTSLQPQQCAADAISRMVAHYCDGDTFIGNQEVDFRELHDKIVEDWDSMTVYGIAFIWGYDHVYVFGAHDEYYGNIVARVVLD